MHLSTSTDASRIAAPVDAQIALWASMLLFVPGLFAPFLTLEKFLIFENTVSLAQTVAILWQDGEAMLAGVVVVFSMLVPVAKLLTEAALCYVALSESSHHRLHHAAQLLSRVSMVEIFVAAILVAAIKIDALATMQVHAGLYFLLGSVLAGLWVSVRVE